LDYKVIIFKIQKQGIQTIILLKINIIKYAVLSQKMVKNTDKKNKQSKKRIFLIVPDFGIVK